MTIADLLIIAMLTTVLVIGTLSGLAVLYRCCAGQPARPGRDRRSLLVDGNVRSPSNRASTRAPRKPTRAVTPQARLQDQYSRTEQDLEEAHREARIAMNEAAGKSWRNLAE